MSAAVSQKTVLSEVPASTIPAAAGPANKPIMATRLEVALAAVSSSTERARVGRSAAAAGRVSTSDTELPRAAA